ncbi:hypothetical protein NNC19_12970 [Clostridium sp. SHJSY1]|uniref:hypothetical protein n=1 Tax=Clostridium sp. SHJSY1 TaxID=2942483 RepID=UPI0028746E0E|nr:hypothetical protein [Clostridium sp. SHJSY1]MDS0526597.1 hypothetical protein [Clostridium sp. SHJSY1]
MKYNFEFSEINFNSGQKDLVIILEKEVELVATFLMSDVQGYPDYAMEALESVLNGQSEYEELNGNVCGLEIRKEKTTVYDNLAEDGMGNWCEIETRELKELVDIWTTKLAEFRKQNHYG